MNSLMIFWLLAAAVLLLNSNVQVNGDDFLYNEGDNNIYDFKDEEPFLTRSLKRAAVAATSGDKDQTEIMSIVNLFFNDNLKSEVQRVLGQMNEEDRSDAYAMINLIFIDSMKSCGFYKNLMTSKDGLLVRIGAGLVKSEYSTVAKKLSKNDQQIMNSAFNSIRGWGPQLCQLANIQS
jgi:hypothetical protein